MVQDMRRRMNGIVRKIGGKVVVGRAKRLLRFEILLDEWFPLRIEHLRDETSVL